ncbi:arylsulfatase [Rhodococcus opacus]|nr:arylsulfatase [Rhodococcus opacus]
MNRSVDGAVDPGRKILPLAPVEVPGDLAVDPLKSTPERRRVVVPPTGAPNIVLVMLDDVGFGHASTFGGPISTPNLTALASRGLSYNRFHTTGMCTPTRAALLTGRNHHSTSFGSVLPRPFPGYSQQWSADTACVAETLRLNGYSTSIFGKWHNTPNAEQSALGPFANWPTSLGFERFYGFIGGDCSQYDPPLISNTTFVDRPDDPDYHLTVDLVDKATSWIREQRALFSHKPFFTYIAPGACHAPHHAPREWIDRYAGAFDHGWDEERQRTFERQLELGVVPPGSQLTPRPAEIPAWDSLSPAAQRVACRLQEAYAGFLEHTDDQLQRVIDCIDELGELDNTLIVYVVGDNGPAAESGVHGALNQYAALNRVQPSPEEMEARIDEIGTPNAFNAVPVGWSWAGSTPFQWVKQVASHYGGTRNPMVMSWPRGISDNGGLRTQFHHVVDIAPTLLEVAGLPQPEMVNDTVQRPLDGVSLAYTIEADGPSRRKRQYFEINAHRAIYEDGWLAGARHPRLPWQFDDEVDATEAVDGSWELYHVEEDFTQSIDLAAAEPERLRELMQLWYAEAGRNSVLPIDGRMHAGSKGTRGLPSRKRFVYSGRVRRVPVWIAPNLLNRSHRISCRTTIQSPTAEGTLVNLGGRYGGYGLFLMNRHLVYAYNMVGESRYVVTSDVEVPDGDVCLTMTFTIDSPDPGSGGEVELRADDVLIGTGRIERTVPYHFALETMFNIGESFGTPVIETYQAPFHFTEQLHEVVIEVLSKSPDTSREVSDLVLSAD